MDCALNECRRLLLKKDENKDKDDFSDYIEKFKIRPLNDSIDVSVIFNFFVELLKFATAPEHIKNILDYISDCFEYIGMRQSIGCFDKINENFNTFYFIEATRDIFCCGLVEIEQRWKIHSDKTKIKHLLYLLDSYIKNNPVDGLQEVKKILSQMDKLKKIKDQEVSNEIIVSIFNHVFEVAQDDKFSSKFIEIIDENEKIPLMNEKLFESIIDKLPSFSTAEKDENVLKILKVINNVLHNKGNEKLIEILDDTLFKEDKRGIVNFLEIIRSTLKLAFNQKLYFITVILFCLTKYTENNTQIVGDIIKAYEPFADYESFIKYKSYIIESLNIYDVFDALAAAIQKHEMVSFANNIESFIKSFKKDFALQLLRIVTNINTRNPKKYYDIFSNEKPKYDPFYNDENDVVDALNAEYTMLLNKLEMQCDDFQPIEDSSFVLNESNDLFAMKEYLNDSGYYNNNRESMKRKITKVYNDTFEKYLHRGERFLAKNKKIINDIENKTFIGQPLQFYGELTVNFYHGMICQIIIDGRIKDIFPLFYPFIILEYNLNCQIKRGDKFTVNGVSEEFSYEQSSIGRYFILRTYMPEGYERYQFVINGKKYSAYDSLADVYSDFNYKIDEKYIDIKIEKEEKERCPTRERKSPFVQNEFFTAMELSKMLHQEGNPEKYYPLRKYREGNMALFDVIGISPSAILAKECPFLLEAGDFDYFSRVLMSNDDMFGRNAVNPNLSKPNIGKILVFVKDKDEKGNYLDSKTKVINAKKQLIRLVDNSITSDFAYFRSEAFSKGVRAQIFNNAAYYLSLHSSRFMIDDGKGGEVIQPSLYNMPCVDASDEDFYLCGVIIGASILNEKSKVIFNLGESFFRFLVGEDISMNAMYGHEISLDSPIDVVDVYFDWMFYGATSKMCETEKDIDESNALDFIDRFSYFGKGGHYRTKFMNVWRGINAVINPSFLKMYTGKQLYKLLSACKKRINKKDMNKYFTYDKHHDILVDDSNKAISIFKEVIPELNDDEQSKFLLFCTGVSGIPIGEEEEKFKIKISIQPGDKLPHSSTCTKTLYLKRYSSKEKMMEDIKNVIKYEDFTLA